MKIKTAAQLIALACTTLISQNARAASFSFQQFATGTTVSGTSPDSVQFGDGSVWIAYQNGADSTGASGSSTVVRYSPTGTVINTWSIKGNVDGLRIDPTGLVWALQNNDGNSALTTINPHTNATAAYTYGSSYTNVANRGFDDVVFTGGQVFLSETNPASATDPVVVKLTTGLSSPLQIRGILNSTFSGANLATGKVGSTAITDSDSLILTPSGDLALTGEADQEIAFIHNPGTSSQTESFVALKGTDGKTISGEPDDTAYATATSGYFYIADTGANTVYKVWATGLTPGSVYVDVGNVFGSLDLSTGEVTPIWSGVSPHGVQFVASVPEPASFAFLCTGLLVGAGLVARRRRARCRV
ncbi:MAG TPA: PEP-CTERM sorting domain-containing protein [Bryobacteraceae bacterium]|jgi:sugar lactone lactonase YvrE|nr:PEP-CTERM sorting domain-containing protein [Bryobacteraceae bacterium]